MGPLRSKCIFLRQINKQTIGAIGFTALFLCLSACSKETATVEQASTQVENKHTNSAPSQPPQTESATDSIVAAVDKQTVAYEGSGGTPIPGGLCPSSPNDIVLPLKSLNLPSAPDEPEMTIAGVKRFMEEKSITDIEGLLSALPTAYRTNFSLVETTKATGQSNLEYPRIVIFGPDARFMMNVGTLKSDPEYHLLDVAGFDDSTGEWEFSQFDFRGEKPVLHVKPEACLRCHGRNHPRPVWGSNMEWDGFFGNNKMEGANPEALSIKHLERMDEIRKGKGNSSRFDFLLWDQKQTLKRGGFRLVRNNQFGAELLISNLAIGSTTARGAFIRLKNTYPEKYAALKNEIVLLGYQHFNKETLTPEQQTKITEKLQQHGGSGNNFDHLLDLLGVDTAEAFSIATLAEEEEPRKDWSLGGGDMYEQVILQVLDDLAQTDPEVANILSATKIPGEKGVFKCPDLADSVKDVVDYKMMQLHHLKGLSRYEVHKVFYPRDAEHIYGKVMLPVKEALVNYLLKPQSS